MTGTDDSSDDAPRGRHVMRDEVAQALHHVTAGLPRPEDRPGQVDMALAVTQAINTDGRLIVQAGTGTGKTIAYLVPAILSGKRTVVSTATKTLQDQLAHSDLPLLEATLPQPFTWSILKGRSNYVCMQRVSEVTNNARLELEDLGASHQREVDQLARWALGTESGDVAELDWQPSLRAWQTVSVGSDECPGAARCESGGNCFAERARARAAAADVLVVNTHLYGMHVAAGGAILPEHDVVIFDEAHQLEDTLTSTIGVSLAASRATTLAAALRRVIADDRLQRRLHDEAKALGDVLAPNVEQRLALPIPRDIVDCLTALRLTAGECLEALRNVDSAMDSVRQKMFRAQQLATRLADDIDATLRADSTYVPFVTGSSERAELILAPLDVGPALAEHAWPGHAVVLTSATIPLSMPHRVGLGDSAEMIDVGSPFEFAEQAMLYCATHLPEPNADRDDLVHSEMADLIAAAGGRTLALFTSRRAMNAAVEALRSRLPFPILAQDENQRATLLREFTLDESACLFATAGFFEGVDIPGRSLCLVIIDRIPFPHRNNPLLAARRELHGPRGFIEIDLPRAITSLAQAAGRLVRSRTDRGVVAVLDPRLAKKGYRWTIINALPPMARTSDKSEAIDFLRSAINDA
ncbi:MAG: ATP-dependent DNA helicase [Actinobacteria bacterium]|nr:ATP-dependent DNA helicase [Actinomycetota bacterium]